jgi:hypothetical protein
MEIKINYIPNMDPLLGNIGPFWEHIFVIILIEVELFPLKFLLIYA